MHNDVADIQNPLNSYPVGIILLIGESNKEMKKWDTKKQTNRFRP